jgi:ATP-dependent Clp protease adaptor protein ClpS
VHQLEQLLEQETVLANPWYVVLFNDEVHTFDDVAIQLVKATGRPMSEAETLAWTVHSKGRARVYDGDLESCLRVSGVLREISLTTEVQG